MSEGDYDDDLHERGDDGGVDGGAGGDDHFDDDEFDPAQPMQLNFFGKGAKQQEEEKYNEQQYDEQQQYDDANGGGGHGGGGDDGSNRGGGGGGGSDHVSSQPNLGDVDALSAADSLPAFASNEVRALDAQVKAKERVLQKFVDEAEENQERVGVMAEHLKNVRQERVHSQALLDAKDNDIGTEGHLGQLAEREYGMDTGAALICTPQTFSLAIATVAAALPSHRISHSPLICS